MTTAKQQLGRVTLKFFCSNQIHVSIISSFAFCFSPLAVAYKLSVEVEAKGLHRYSACEPQTFYLPTSNMKNYGILFSLILEFGARKYFDCIHKVPVTVPPHNFGSTCYTAGCVFLGSCARWWKPCSHFTCKAGPGAMNTPEKNRGSTNNSKGVIVDSQKFHGLHAPSSPLEGVWWWSLPSPRI